MKNLIIITILLISSFHSMAQSFNLGFDHTTIVVKDVDKSVDFYTNILHFKEMETPWGFIKWGAFIDLGNNQQLHITLGETDSLKLTKMLHLAFTINDFDGYLKFLNEKGIEYGDFSGKNKKFQTRPDGVRQIYFQDPDGYWIEVNDH